MHDGQEPIHADASEKEDAPVHVGVKQRHGHFAKHAPERPVLVDEIEHPERQRKDEQKIGRHQVHHVGCGFVPQLQRAGENINSNHICYEPDHENNTENCAVQRILEGVIFWARGIGGVRGLLDRCCVQKSCVVHPGVPVV